VRSDAYFVNFEDGIATDSKTRMSPLVDVADILWSFEDAGTITLNAAQGVDTSTETTRLQQISVKYRRKTSDAFYKAYKSAAAHLPHHWQFENGEESALRLARIDNRLREVLKASHRPDWLHVPLDGLIRECEDSLKPDS